MAEPKDKAEETALWRRWRSAVPRPAAAEPDMLLLAAYAEGRLDAAQCDAVEEWLAADPALVEDILAARRAAEALPEAPPALVARASALVGNGGAQVLAFRRPTPRWRAAAAWAGMAASLVVTSLVGFSLGTDTSLNLAGRASSTLSQELLDPPSGMFNTLDEDSTI